MKIKESIRRLEKKYDKLKQEVKKLYKKLEELENKIESGISINPIPVELKNNQEFLEEEKWISEQKSSYSNEIIAYMKKGKELILLAHSEKENLLLKKIDELIDQQIISEEDIIYFR